MRILHLYSDYRWTGPAEPTVNLCLNLRARGHTVFFACRKTSLQAKDVGIAERAKERGLEAITRFALNRYIGLWDTFHDLWTIPRFLREEKIEVVHAHLSHDHGIGGWCARRCGLPIAVVRTNHKGVPLRPGLLNRILLHRMTDHLIEISDLAASGDRAAFALDSSQVSRANVALDLKRFDPSLPLPDVRARLGASPSDILVGVVARIQRHRRFDVLLQGFALALKEMRHLRLVILGRGTYQDVVAKEPARRMGLGDRVLFPGFIREDYVAALKAFDMKVFLVPGSDGSCRAAREAMAMGKPIICARRGMLPEIVSDGLTGLVIDDTPENLARAIVRLALDAELRQRMGRAAREKMLAEYSPEAETKAVEEAYEAALRKRRGGGSPSPVFPG